ncbi:MAG: hypothetical protein OXI86_12930, partial [Candidatus Poribacteria bacterium]|nr:hypothetical protein [Candidatus Poribacteria bacterium]
AMLMSVNMDGRIELSNLLFEAGTTGDTAEIEGRMAISASRFSGVFLALCTEHKILPGEKMAEGDYRRIIDSPEVFLV